MRADDALILIALAAAAATSIGIASERRWTGARHAAQRTLQVMLYVLIPFVSYVNIAHLQITVSGGVGLALGWVVIATGALLARVAGRSLLHLPNRQLGAVICCVAITNTGYLGNPIIGALLGSRALRYGIAYDQLVGGPALFVLGFGVGATYGDAGAVRWRDRARTFLTRNPPLLAVVAGLIVSPRLAPAPLLSISHVVVDAMLVTGFFAAGVYLSSERRDDHAPLIELPDGPVALVLAVRLLIAPLILLGLSAAVVAVPKAYLVQAFMPTGLNSLVVGHAYGLDQRLIATAILWGSAIVLVAALAVGFA